MAQPGWFPDPTSRWDYRFWDGSQWTARVSRNGVEANEPVGADSTAPAPIPAATPAHTSRPPATYTIREEGKNGTVEIFDDHLVRTRSKHIGKSDVQTFPIRAITAVSHDRKTLGTDEVKIQFGSISYEWKVKNAEQMVADLHSRMFNQ